MDPERLSRWRSWAAGNHDLLAAAYSSFAADGDWPKVAALQRNLDRNGTEIDVGAALVSMPPELGFRDGEQLVLTALGCSYTPGAGSLLADYQRALDLAYARYQSEEAAPVLRSSDLDGELELADDQAARVSALLLREGPGLGSGTGDVDSGWERNITEQIRVVGEAGARDELVLRIAARRWPAPDNQPAVSAPASVLLAPVRWLRQRTDQLTVAGSIAAAVLTAILIGGIGFLANSVLGGEEENPRDTTGPIRAEQGTKADSASPVEDFPLPRATKPAALDMAVAGRLVDGPRQARYRDFVGRLPVQHGNVVLVASIVVNPDADDSDSLLSNVRLRFEMPTDSGTTASITATATADNQSDSGPYRQSESLSLSGAAGRPFAMSKPRAVVVQQNEPEGKVRFSWGRALDMPPSTHTTRLDGRTVELTVRPTLDGTLGPGFDEATRVIFLVDINGA